MQFSTFMIHASVALLKLSLILGSLAPAMAAVPVDSLKGAKSALLREATDFSNEGNRAVAERYRGFLSRPGHCEIKGPGRRVMLTGFGLFQGVPFNVSGALMENFAQPEIWPEEILTAEPPRRLEPSIAIARGILADESGGVKVMNRRLKINGIDTNLCLILVDVLWDFAGAVITSEMERFQPDLVVMSGRGSSGVTLESAARNTAIPFPGFKSNGETDGDNIPISPTIQTEREQELVVAMTWDNQALARRVAPFVKKIGHETRAPKAWSPGNDYICNNLSFIAVHAAGGTPIGLAGGLITAKPVLQSMPQIGFMHLPAIAGLTRESLPIWVKVYASLIDQAFLAN